MSQNGRPGAQYETKTQKIRLRTVAAGVQFTHLLAEWTGKKNFMKIFGWSEETFPQHLGDFSWPLMLKIQKKLEKKNVIISLG